MILLYPVAAADISRSAYLHIFSVGFKLFSNDVVPAITMLLNTETTSNGPTRSESRDAKRILPLIA
ncbi:MAG: hypothetical protein ACLUD2_14730 [Clostridium sp.]